MVDKDILARFKAYRELTAHKPKLTKGEIYGEMDRLSKGSYSDLAKRKYLHETLKGVTETIIYGARPSGAKALSIRDSYDLSLDLAKRNEEARDYEGAADAYSYAALVAEKAHANSTSKSLYKKSKENLDRLGKDGRFFDRRRNLEQKVLGIAAIFCLFFGAIFISSSITGNAIGNMTNSTSSVIGACLLVVGLIAGLFWMKNRRR